MIRKLTTFLIKAKMNTYALGGEGGEKIFPDGNKEFEFKEEEFKYRDRYFGFNPFLGEEVVFQNGKIIWGMNYYGRVISKDIPPKEIYQLLKEALRKVPKSKPFRGPESFKKYSFQYLNKAKGTIKEFSGKEKIFYQRKLVYTLIYHGGIIGE